jgi:hypothetical protein
VEEPLEIGEQEATLAGWLADAAVEWISGAVVARSPPARQAQLAPSPVVVAGARVVDGVDDDTGAERLGRKRWGTVRQRARRRVLERREAGRPSQFWAEVRDT